MDHEFPELGGRHRRWDAGTESERTAAAAVISPFLGEDALWLVVPM
jgi:hypothetical protein